MKFSIVIPVFKTEHLLKRCLDGFAAQTEGDFEAIVVDDASPAEESRSRNGASCEEIVAQYDDRFKYVRHDRNLSLFQARQTGLRRAQGDYVVPFDSDDYALPRLLEELRKAIDGSSPSTSVADVVVYQMMYDNGRRITRPSVRYKDERMTGVEALDRFFQSKIQCAICGKAIRREVYLKAMDELAAPQDFYLNSSEDLCQTFPVLMNAQSVATISYPGYRYWLNGDSLTTTLTDPAKLGRAAENTRRVFDALSGFVSRNGHEAALLPRLEKFLEPTLEWYLGCIRHEPEANWRACAAELCKYFPPDLVARKAMMLVADSNTYKLGRALLFWRGLF